MDALTPDDLARIEELAEKATQEPWVLSRSKNWIAAHGDDLFRVTACDADAALVIELRNLAPALVAGVRSLQARLAQAEATIETIGKSAQDGLADCDDDYEMSSLWVLDQCNSYRTGAAHG